MIQFKREKKLTRRDFLIGLKDLIIDGYTPIDEDKLIGFLDKELSLIDGRAEKEAERREEERAKGDDIRDALLDLLTEEPQTADDFYDVLGSEDVTRKMITARLIKLTKEDKIVTGETKEGKKKLVTYKLKS